MADDAKPEGRALANLVAEAGVCQVTLRLVVRGSESTTRLSAVVATRYTGRSPTKRM